MYPVFESIFPSLIFLSVQAAFLRVGQPIGEPIFVVKIRELVLASHGPFALYFRIIFPNGPQPFVVRESAIKGFISDAISGVDCSGYPAVCVPVVLNDVEYHSLEFYLGAIPLHELLLSIVYKVNSL